MSAPTIRGPRDMPALREWIAEQWKPGRSFATAAASLFTSRDVGLFGRLPHVDGYTYSDWERRTFERATLWWVGDEMVDLLLAVAATMPDDLVWSDLAPPAPAGFVVLSKPWIGNDSETEGNQMTIDGFAWAGARLPPGIPGRAPDAPLVTASLSCYQRLDFDRGLIGHELSHALATGATALGAVEMTSRSEGSLHGEVWVPLGRSDWPIGDRLADPPWPMEEVRTASVVEDRRTLAALFVLLQKEAVASRVVERADRPTRRRAERHGHSIPDVQVVTLRRPRSEPSPDHDPEEHPVEWSCRWIVQPHVRLQPYGPGRSLRRAILVGPYVKGPEDKPLKVPTRVNAWVR